MQIDHPNATCQNPNCDCEVEAGQAYCSEYCRNAVAFSGSDFAEVADDAPCQCSHERCDAQA